MREFWVVIEKIDDSSLGLIGKCAELADARGLCPVVVMLSDTGLEAQQDACRVLCEEAQERKPAAIVFECTLFFSTVAPAFAIRLGAGITADCTGLEWSKTHGLLQIRPTFGGRKIAVNRCLKEPYLATVRRGTFARGNFTWPDARIEVRTLEVRSDSKIRFLRYLTRDFKRGSLENADLIFAGGLGLGSKENFELLRILADKVGASLGASRGAVTSGFASFDHQVGQTGVSVHPKLYVAFGISGAVQHLSGILGAEKIVAVNTDPKAPIRDYADYFIEADAVQVIETMLNKIESQ